MTSINPFIKCTDFWPGKIPPEKLAVYKEMVDEKQITKPHIVYNRISGATCVEYYSIAPHEWIREEMRRRV